MKKVESPQTPDANRPVRRGKYAHMLEAGSNIAVLDADLAAQFPDSAAVNHALRAFLAFGREFATLVPPPAKARKVTNVTSGNAAFDPLAGDTKRRSLSRKVA